MMVQQVQRKQKRNIAQMVADIINSCPTPTRMTVIMRSANVDMSIFKQLMEILIKLGLVETVKMYEGIYYRKTELASLNYALLCELGSVEIHWRSKSKK